MSLYDDLVLDEGMRLKPYVDSVGKLTIGVGRNLDDRGLLADEIELMLTNDIAQAERDLCVVFPQAQSFSQERKDALSNMLFNLGLTRFNGFKQMIVAINGNDWEEAAIQAMDSKWAQQVGSRATRIRDKFLGV